MKVEIKKINNVALLQVSGSLDADSVPQFKKTVLSAVESGSVLLVVDATKLEFIDSMGLGCLISLLRRVRTHKGDLKVAGLSPEVKQIFEMTRLHRLFDIFPTWEVAAETFS